MKTFLGLGTSAWIGLGFVALRLSTVAQDPYAPVIQFSVDGSTVGLRFEPAPAVERYSIWSSPDLNSAFVQESSDAPPVAPWRSAIASPSAFYQVRAHHLSPDQLYATTLLQRIAYGPTPDELERVLALGADAYLAEQLAPENIAEDLGLETDEPPPPPPVIEADGWRKVVVTGVSTVTSPSSNFYIYLPDNGDAYLDEVRLVAGTAEDLAKPNLLQNGDFESVLSGPWSPTDNFTNSVVTTAFRHSGASSLHLVADDAGSGSGNAIIQVATGVTSGQSYTLSYWWRPGSQFLPPVLRLSGATADDSTTLTSAKPPYKTMWGKLMNGYGSLADLRRWHLLNAVQSKRQLLEVLRQFLENHFVTQYTKASDYLAAYYDNGTESRAATQIELRENLRWRAALLKPQVTFLDLLKISAESPAMILYLDTVNSRGNATRDGNGVVTKRNIANENYARELCELFCFGVDNGYDQQDLVEISRAWTGWTIGYKKRSDDNNPFGVNYFNDPTIAPTGAGIQDFSLYWTVHYREGRHDERTKYCFYDNIKRDAQQNVTSAGQPKLVPARFGAPWAGRAYGLRLTGSTTTNSIQEAYQILQHMANQPFTQEYISVKLCRLFVHDGFHHGYDFTDADVTPEEQLVHECMMAWENPPNGGPKGQLRPVLRVILTSDLFRNHSGSLQKIKTPLEYAVSATRALRAKKPDGTYTAETRGLEDITELLNDAGRMRLFDRGDPDGYPEEGTAWISAGTMAERLQFIERSLTKSTTAGAVRSAPDIDPLTLLRLKRPELASDAGGVADYFLGLLFPAEGKANLAEYRAVAIQFLNTAANGVTPSAFSALRTNTTEYENRIRGMVSFLMTTQRFQEQ